MARLVCQVQTRPFAKSDGENNTRLTSNSGVGGCSTKHQPSAPAAFPFQAGSSWPRSGGIDLVDKGADIFYCTLLDYVNIQVNVRIGARSRYHVSRWAWSLKLEARSVGFEYPIVSRLPLVPLSCSFLLSSLRSSVLHARSLFNTGNNSIWLLDGELRLNARVPTDLHPLLKCWWFYRRSTTGCTPEASCWRGIQRRKSTHDRLRYVTLKYRRGEMEFRGAVLSPSIGTSIEHSK